MKIVKLLIGVLILISGSVNSQNQSYQKLAEQWQDFREANDNEKDYRKTTFLESIEFTLKQSVSVSDSLNILPGWHSDTTEDNRFVVHSAYIAYDMRPDQLFYCLHDQESNDIFAFSREMDEKYEISSLNTHFDAPQDVDPSMHSLDFIIEKDVVLNIPDIDLAIVLEKLVRSRGGHIAFDLSETLMARLKVILSQPEWFENDLSGYSALSTLLSEDDVLKTVTWNLEDKMGDHFFYGLVAVRLDDKVEVFELEDKRHDIESPEYAKLKPSNWFGAVYYDVVLEKHRGDIHYVLLGYNGNDAFSKMRVVDVIQLSSDGVPSFGASVFDIAGRIKRRLIFEYSNQANMMLRYDDRDDLIIMDHLAPVEPSYQGNRSYYGPDFSYDALEFNKGKWILLEDIDIRNR